MNPNSAEKVEGPNLEWISALVKKNCFRLDQVRSLRLSDEQLTNLIGGKAYGLSRLIEMNLAPLGFVLSTELGKMFSHGNGSEALLEQALRRVLPEQIAALEKWNENSERPNTLTKCKFGDAEHPLLFSVRSGAPFSMPGAMETVLNVGINENTLPGLIQILGEQAAYECYLNFILTFVPTVYHIPKSQLLAAIEQEGIPPKAFRQRVEILLAYLDQIQVSLTQDPLEQLTMAIGGVYNSYNEYDASITRHRQGLPENAHTAVTVMPMIFGNYPTDKSGSGVAFTTDMTTGEGGMSARYSSQAQGIAIVAEGTKAEEITELPLEFHQMLEQVLEKIRNLYTLTADVEFVFEDGKLNLLQVREGKPAPTVLLEKLIAYGMDQTKKMYPPDVPEWMIRPGIAVTLLMKLITPEMTKLTEQLQPDRNSRPIAAGDPIGGRGFIGKITTNWATALKLAESEPVVFATTELNPNQMTALSPNLTENIGYAVQGGSSHSHAAAVTNAQGGVGILGLKELVITPEGVKINGCLIANDEIVSLDGRTGKLYRGAIPTQTIDPDPITAHYLRARSHMGAVWNQATIGLLRVGYEHAQIISQFQKAKKYLPYLAPKAVTQALINRFYPIPDELIAYEVVSLLDYRGKVTPQSIVEIKTKVKSILSQGRQASIRSCFAQRSSKKGTKTKFGVNPWIYFNPGDEVEGGLLDQFFNEQQSLEVGHRSRHGQWKDWLDLEESGVRLTEVLIGNDPPGKLNPEDAQHHFVLTLGPGGGDTHLEALLMPGTIQVRSLENTAQQPLDTARLIRMQIFPDNGTIVRVNYAYGRGHLDPENVVSMAEKILSPSHNESRQVRLLRQQLALKLIPDLDISELKTNFDQTGIAEQIYQLSEQGELLNSVVSELLKPESKQLVDSIFRELLKRWENLTNFMAKLEIWTQGTPMTAEFQGRLGTGNGNISLNWFSMYGIKGLEEALTNTPNLELAFPTNQKKDDPSLWHLVITYRLILRNLAQVSRLNSQVIAREAKKIIAIR